MSLFTILCPYCRKKIPLSSIRCPECRSVMPHECGETERRRILIFGAAAIGLVIVTSLAAIVWWILS